MKKNLHLLFLLLAPVMPLSQAAEPVLQQEKLTANELQDILGITAYRPNVPADLGARPRLLVEQYADGKLISRGESSLFFEGSSRSALVTWRDDNDRLVVTHRTNHGGGSSNSPAKPDGLHYDLCDNCAGEAKDSEIVILRRQFFKLNGNDSSKPGAKVLVGEIVVKIAKE